LQKDITNATTKRLSVKNGNIKKWEKAIEEIKSNPKGNLQYSNPYLHIKTTINDEIKLIKSLQSLTPWRKGPYKIENITIESEWGCNLKWDRISPHISPLKNKTVLDVGASNGYFSYKMAMLGANIVLGVEPFLLFNYQFKATRSLIKNPPKAFVLPISLEDIPNKESFDTVFSMGVLYHQKDYKKHLQKLKNVMKPNGELVLETLVINSKYGTQIIPKDRYARMRNVYCLPSVNTLNKWLKSAGFKNIELININQTSVSEQKATSWIGENTKSLKDFLNPNDINYTIEGLPAPIRATFICNK
jgi:tRNA (mo5U34)-methyltransferase